jgi:hypothetical protein
MRTAPCLALLAGLLMPAEPAFAERTSTRLTRDKTEDHLYAFAVKAVRQKEAGADVCEFQVTATPKSEASHIAKPRLAGHLEVKSGKELISSCALEAKARGGERSYSFRVGAKHLKDSTFVFSETLDSEQPDLALQGFYYWFTLADFVEP